MGSRGGHRQKIKSAQGGEVQELITGLWVRPRFLVWCQSDVIGNSTGQATWLKACPLFYLGETQHFTCFQTLYFSISPTPIGSICCAVSPASFLFILLGVACITFLSVLSSVSPARTHARTHAHTHTFIFNILLRMYIWKITEINLTVHVGNTRDSQRGLKFHPLVMFCSHVHA